MRLKGGNPKGFNGTSDEDYDEEESEDEYDEDNDNVIYENYERDDEDIDVFKLR
jgi:hypothetical protein